MRNKTDEIITKILIDGTKEAIEYKDRVWNNIDNVLDDKANINTRCSRKLYSKGNRIKALVKVAAIVCVVFLVFKTSLGVQAINKIKSMLAPNKNVVHKIEGKGYQHQVDLVESKNGYTIYIDENVFKVEHLKDRDKIIPKKKSSKIPEVYMEIQLVTDTKPEVIFSKLQKKLKKSSSEVYDNGKVSKPLDAFSIAASSGTRWNDKLVKYYIVDNKKGGSFMITQHLFVEAAEGFGSRFDNCLMEFRLEE